jgi:hypothetical protein
MPDSIWPLDIVQTYDEPSGITSVQAILPETTGPVITVLCDYYHDDTEAYVFMVWTQDAQRYSGMLKRVIGTFLQQATAAGYKSIEFRNMVSTAEVIARGAKAIDANTVRIDLTPPGAFANWLAGELKQLA